jgi:hypothetical protein
VVLVLGIVYSSFKHGLNKGASQGEELTKTNYTSSGALAARHQPKASLQPINQAIKRGTSLRLRDRLTVAATAKGVF